MASEDGEERPEMERKSSRVDFQNHWTTKSRVLSLDSIFEQTERKLGVRGVVGLVNYDDRRYEATIGAAKGNYMDLKNAVYSPTHQVLIVKGEEVRTQEGDLLVMGLKAGFHPKHGKPLGYTIDKCRDNNGIVIITTPYYRSSVGRFLETYPDTFEEVDAVEVHNGNAPRMANQRAVALYEKGLVQNRNLGQLSSSDGHSFGEVGNSFTNLYLPSLECLETPEGVVSFLKDGIRQARESDHQKNENSMGKWVHKGIISAMIASSKLPKEVQGIPPFRQILVRGDREALLS